MSRSVSQRKPRRRKTNQPVKPGLKGFAEARKSPNELLREIQRHVVAEGIKNSGEGRESHKIHVSELVKDVCPRHLYYKVSQTPTSDPPQGHGAQLEMIWAAGNSEHEKWQRWLWGMGDLWGTFRCRVCSHEWEALAPQSCPECDSVLLEYREVELEDEDFFLVGHADGAVPRLNTLVEVKSFAIGTVRMEDPKRVSEHTYKVDGKSVVHVEGLWESLKRPLKSHVVQGLMYLWMCKRMGLPYDKITFIYENKTTQATKTFVVKLAERHLTDYLDILAEVKWHLQAGVVPDRPALFDKGSRPCSSCVFKTHCYEETSDNPEETSAVPARRSRSRSQEAGGEAEVRTARAPRNSDSEGARRPHRPRRRGLDDDDGSSDEVGRAPRSATRDGGGGRTVGRRSAGEAQGPRIARRRREERH